MEDQQGRIDNSDEAQTGVPAPHSDLFVATPPEDNAASVAEFTGSRFYIASPAASPFLQTEILSNVTEHRLVLDSANSDDGPEFEQITHGLAIIVSQDCDLEQDYYHRVKLKEARQALGLEDEKLLPSILLCQAGPESAISKAMRGTTVRDRFFQNKEERYQFLKAVEAQYDAQKIGIEAMGIDFKRLFTVPTEELYTQLSQDCKRRCSLAPQYLEHFSRRFTNYLSRVALPKDHHR